MHSSGPRRRAWARDPFFSCCLALLLLATLALAPARAQAPVAEVPALPGQAGRLLPLGEYPSARRGASLVALDDGTVYIHGLGEPLHQAGGHAALTGALRHRQGRVIPSGPHAQPLLWDPRRRGWLELPWAPECPSDAHYLHTATALPDGRVLLAGGLCDRPQAHNEPLPRQPHVALSLLDVRARRWLPAPALKDGRFGHSATLMPDGSVFIVGGEADPALVAPAAQDLHLMLTGVERFAANAVTAMPPLAVARALHSATALGDGGLLVAGGVGGDGRPLAEVERWLPGEQAWRRVPPLAQPRYGHTATRLRDGRVLVAGGIGRDGQRLSSVELWDPASGAWSAGPPLPMPLHGHAAALLPSGEVLVAGGAWQVHVDPVPWAWVLDAAAGAWRVAGRAEPKGEPQAESLSTPLALQPRADGAQIFLANQVLRWTTGSVAPDTLPPRWLSRPSLAALADGAVLAIGPVEGGRGPEELQARLWQPGSGRWQAAGVLPGRERLRSSALQAGDGRVLHVAVDGNRLVCQGASPGDWAWSDCGGATLATVQSGRVQLDRLADGRVVAVASTDDVLVHEGGRWTPWRVEWRTDDKTWGTALKEDTPLARILDPVSGRWHEINDAGARHWQEINHDRPRLLWSAKLQRWEYVRLDGAMGRSARLLPDGCSLSLRPLALFDPASAQVRGLADPGLAGIDDPDWLVLPDGLMVLAGVGHGAGDAGTGFFQRRVGCQGFAAGGAGEPVPFGSRILPAEEAPGVAAAASAAPAASAAAPAPRPGLWQRVAQPLHLLKLMPGLWAVLPLLALLAWGWRRRGGEPSWGQRLVFWGVVLALAWPPLRAAGQLRRLQAEDACRLSPAGCPHTAQGLIAGDPAVRDAVTLPCRYVGVWTSRRDQQARRLELHDDGRYSMGMAMGGRDFASGYQGRWAVQGPRMIWRHDNLASQGLDGNLIVPVDGDRFELIEQDGTRTRLNRAADLPRQRCNP